MLIGKNKAIGKLQMLDTVDGQLHPATVRACIQAIKEMSGEPLRPMSLEEAIKPNMEAVQRALGVIEGVSIAVDDGLTAQALVDAVRMIDKALWAESHET